MDTARTLDLRGSNEAQRNVYAKDEFKILITLICVKNIK